MPHGGGDGKEEEAKRKRKSRGRTTRNTMFKNKKQEPLRGRIVQSQGEIIRSGLHRHFYRPNLRSSS